MCFSIMPWFYANVPSSGGLHVQHLHRPALSSTKVANRLTKDSCVVGH